MAYEQTDRISIRKTATGIDATAVAATTIFTTEASRTFVVTDVIFRITAATGFISAATASIGTNASTYNDILTATALTGVSAVNNFIKPPVGAAVLPAVPASTALKVNITVGAVATGLTLAVDVFGYYL